ncbi:MAG: type VI secretion system tube protein Hcp [Candidatus Sedimenticola sp. (ex Thyasira tokunagai)]
MERANHGAISFTKYVDSSITPMLKALWSGSHIAKGKVTCYRSDGAINSKPVAYLVVDLEQVVISNYSISGGSGSLPVENFSFTYGKVTYTYLPADEKSGKKGGALTTNHNLLTEVIE